MQIGPKEYLVVVRRGFVARLSSSAVLAGIGISGALISASLAYFKADPRILTWVGYGSTALTAISVIGLVFISQYDAWKREAELRPEIMGEFYELKLSTLPSSPVSNYGFQLYLCSTRARISVKSVKAQVVDLSGNVEFADVSFRHIRSASAEPLILEPAIGQIVSATCALTKVHFATTRNFQVIVIDAYTGEHKFKARDPLPFPFAVPYGEEAL